MDALRGADDDRARVEKMRKLDVKIKEVCLRPSSPAGHVTELAIAARCCNNCP